MALVGIGDTALPELHQEVGAGDLAAVAVVDVALDAVDDVGGRDVEPLTLADDVGHLVLVLHLLAPLLGLHDVPSARPSRPWGSCRPSPRACRATSRDDPSRLRRWCRRCSRCPGGRAGRSTARRRRRPPCCRPSCWPPSVAAARRWSRRPCRDRCRQRPASSVSTCHGCRRGRSWRTSLPCRPPSSWRRPP